MQFTHLHLHTEYSLLDGLSKVDTLIKWVKQNDMDSVAITDHGAMYGVVEFYKKCQKEGVKPILGMEAYTTNVAIDFRGERGKIVNYHLLLLAKDLEGYKNLMKLASEAHLKGYYYRPRVDRETLAKYAKGLVCTSACPQGELAQSIINDDPKETKSIIDWFSNVFGDDYYLEVQRHHYGDFAAKATNGDIKAELTKMAGIETKVNAAVIELSRQYGIPLVATNDAHYIKAEDASAQDALVCIATGKNVSDVKRLRFIDAPSYYVKTPAQMRELFADLPDACDNTVKIAEKCNVTLTLGSWFFPEFKVPGDVDPPTYLRQLASQRLAEKFPNPTQEYLDRLDYELEIIIKKGYAPYFLIVMDLANWASSARIVTNTRGSAAGSLVSYCLGITTVNPLYYNLPFERFLNPYRPSPPDIDFDVADIKRDQVIGYITDTYGANRVAQVCTFGRMLARASVRDIARVLGYPYAKGDEIAKLIPLGSQGFPMTIEKALATTPAFAEIYNSDADCKKIVDLAKQVEGNARHISVHAAGVVVAPTDITDFSPVQHEPSGDKVITQYEMHASEDVGLIKFDILGIRNLSFLGASLDLVKQTKGIDVDLRAIPLDNKKTFEMLSRGETMGVFQLAGGGMTKYLKDLAPNRIEDLMAMVALYRPGPMSVIPEYIERKRNPKLVKYLDPRMKKFLDKSYGLIVYQDDLLFCALDLAGYSWEEADKFRKAVGKKIPEEMAAQKKKFIDGIISNGQTQDFADNLWKLFEPFQSYGFNKAHAASYGMVAYQTAYMKANYPVEYMTALLSAESGDSEKVALAVHECRRMGIIVHPPSVNESEIGFSVVKDPNSIEGLGIRFGLNAIKNVGGAAIEAILAGRTAGPFTSFEDFCSRVDGRKVNKKVLESLIKVGAFSDFGNRSTLLTVMDEIREKVRPKVENGQDALFADEMESLAPGGSIVASMNVPEFSDEQKEQYERQLLGFSLSARPVSELLKDISALGSHKIFEIKEALNAEGELVKVAAVVSEVRVIVTKRTGEEMAFVKIEDETGMLEAVVFPRLYKDTRALWVERQSLLLNGKVNIRDNDTYILIEKAATGADTSSDEVLLKIPKDTSRETLAILKKLLLTHPGTNEVVLHFEGTKDRMKLGFRIGWSADLAHEISQVLSTPLS